jgi:hypothetical protein
MGGQACVFYGAAEFSRDVDLVVLADDKNIQVLKAALNTLNADVIAVPAFDPAFLQRGLVIHFRCKAPGVEGMRIDIMSNMRGVAPFHELWERRTTLEIDQIEIDLLSLPDLVTAKKTQRSKDWPMLKRLVEAHWFQNRHQPNPQRIDFWLRECRTPEILTQLTDSFPTETLALHTERPLLKEVRKQDLEIVEKLLENERLIEVAKDKAYWKPLRNELEQLRINHNK